MDELMEAGGGAVEVYAWAIENPDKVACIYAGKSAHAQHPGENATAR